MRPAPRRTPTRRPLPRTAPAPSAPAGPKCGKDYSSEELADLFFDPFIHVDDGITSYHLIFFLLLMAALGFLFFLM